MPPLPPQVPPTIGAAADAVVAARGQAGRLARVFHRSPVPMVMVDDERRYVDVNRPALLVLRLTVAKLLSLRVDDLTPPYLRPVMEAAWARLIGAGFTAGPYELAVPDGGRLGVVLCGRAHALPGRHVIAFAPADWSDAELELLPWGDEPEPSAPLTPRELDVLQLAAEGRTGPRIADELVLSPATVKTHFENIYAKLGVTDRPTAVAKAIRLGLID